LISGTNVEIGNTSGAISETVVMGNLQGWEKKDGRLPPALWCVNERSLPGIV
jgi:hypothetical protein